MPQLTEATASLEAKTQAVAELESQIATLQASLIEAQNKGATVEELEKAKAQVESEVASLKAALEEARSGQDSDSALLKTVQQEVFVQSSVSIYALSSAPYSLPRLKPRMRVNLSWLPIFSPRLGLSRRR